MSREPARSCGFGGELEVLFQALATGRKVGAGRAFFAALARDEELFRKVVIMACDLGPGPVYDVRRVGRLLGIELTPAELEAIGPPPGPLPGFVTFFDPGWSLLRLREVVGDRDVFFPQDWYDAEGFARAEDPPGYRQVRKGPVPGSLRKTYEEQLPLLTPGEDVPPARVMAAAVAVHFLAAGERLSPTLWVRCADESSRGGRVILGSYGDGAHAVGYHRDDDRSKILGLASLRRS